MPKSFSDSEKEYIKKRLLEEAAHCLSQYGVRKTTVDEIVRRVNIPKGTFYLFYPSKERLLFDVILQFNETIQTELIDEVSALQIHVTPEKLTNIIYSLYKKLDDSFLPRLIADGELDLFMRKLPPELSKLHAEKDDLSFSKLLDEMPGIEIADVRIISAAFRGIFLSLLHKQDIGEDVFDEALKVMIRGVVMQMFEEAEV